MVFTDHSVDEFRHFYLFKKMSRVPTLRRELLQDESTSLSFDDITRVLKGRVKQLKSGFVDASVEREFTLDTFFKNGRTSCFVILSAKVDRKTQRHWISLVKNEKGLFFFDPLAFKLKTLKMMITSPKFIDFVIKHKFSINTHKVQREISAIKTCGLHAIIRIAKHSLTNDEYAKWIHSIPMNPDETVAMLTYLGNHT